MRAAPYFIQVEENDCGSLCLNCSRKCVTQNLLEITDAVLQKRGII